MPGTQCCLRPAGHNNCIRLNYSCMPEEKIEQGMTILGEVIKENIKK